MRIFRQKGFFALILILALVFVSACNSNNGAAPKPEAPTTENGGSNNATPDEVADPLGKYDPPIEVSTVRVINDTFKYAEGDSIDDNVWYRAYLEELGINLKNDWVVSGGGVGGPGEQKMNVTIASGDLPDIIPVDAKQLQQLLEADLIMDMSDIYEQYASSLTKEILVEDGGKTMDSATFDGKLMALPNTGSSMDGAPMIWVRQDWLEELNLPEPKTMDDVVAIAEAFAKKEAGNVGLVTFKDLFGGYAGLEGFFNGFHAYRDIWMKDDSGQLIYSSIQPEVKTALAKLQEMFAAGLLDKEFGVKDEGKAGEAQGAGKNGLNFGQMWNPLFPLYASYDNDPTAQWQSYPIVSFDDQPAKPQVNLSVGGYFAVSKDAKNPEAAVKMLNLWFEKMYGETADRKFGTDNGLEVFKYALVQAHKARKNLDNHLAIVEALDSGDDSNLNPEQQTSYDMIQSYLAGEEGESNRWANDRVFGHTGSFVTIKKYVDEDLLMVDEFTGAPTPTMVDKGSSLAKMQLEVFSKIIMGTAPIEDFDKYVADWKKVGGDDITKEVNEWYSAK